MFTVAFVFALGASAKPRARAVAQSAAVDAGSAAALDSGSVATALANAVDASTGPSDAIDAGAPASSALTPAEMASSVPTYRHRAPPLPPPTAAQIAAYNAMRQEADTFQQGAGDYKNAITTIVTLHYEEEKKSILGGLDREIGIEKGELKTARDGAIKRLEDFVAKYDGPNAQPTATPDAMYRLAALYEERARSDDDPNADL
ncbi:MAG: hypothetical protein ACREJ3_14795, partial [Polyangiaceae bacterium]